jgi:hypothetical protein
LLMKSPTDDPGLPRSTVLDCWILDWNESVMESDPVLHADTTTAPTKPNDM